MNLERLLAVGDVAALLGVSPHTVYAWSSKRVLPVVKVGARTMFDPVEIRRWVELRSRAAAGASSRRAQRCPVPPVDSEGSLDAPAGSEL